MGFFGDFGGGDEFFVFVRDFVYDVGFCGGFFYCDLEMFGMLID